MNALDISEAAHRAGVSALTLAAYAAPEIMEADRRGIAECYSAMIDAILNEKEEPNADR